MTWQKYQTERQIQGKLDPVSNAYNNYDLASTITKAHLFKQIENFTTKHWKFSDKNSDIFHISAQNIDYRYEAVLTSTRNLCFLAGIRNIIYIPL